MRKSAGIVLYRLKQEQLQVFLVHPGGPYWKAKEEGAWSIPKGEFTDEDPLLAAQREFKEETGKPIDGSFIQLTPIKQRGGKMVYAWAVEGDIDATTIVSNTFKQEYPYKSGKWQTYPEVDRAAWFDASEAKRMINPAQVLLVDEILALISRHQS